ncbi:MAG: SGNH/GDSL hydrolase family protein [Clostridia bacterium]|nr:SGNH/GDSL hydrolase family protein [Clostridia bacterium]
MSKKRILCFGDSLTWGYNPLTGGRHDENIRWTGVLQTILGSDYVVIEEGQNGRTIATDDPCEGEKNGLKYVLPCMESQKPFDLMVVMLGTNDLKIRFNYVSTDIADEMEILIKKILAFVRFTLSDKARVLLIAPPLVGENISESAFGESFGYKRACEVSSELANLYKALAGKYELEFLNAADYVKTSPADSIHLDEDSNKILGKVIADKVAKML